MILGYTWNKYYKKSNREKSKNNCKISSFFNWFIVLVENSAAFPKIVLQHTTTKLRNKKPQDNQSIFLEM
jgi:hypothetical protein